MELKIQDSACWICGLDKDITYHHVLPRHWKPLKNVLVPICVKCHERLNAEDVEGMRQFAFKIEQELGRQIVMWGSMRVNMGKMTKCLLCRIGIHRHIDTQTCINRDCDCLPFEPKSGRA